MDQTSRAQVRLILDDTAIRSKKAVETRIKEIYAKRLAMGALLSGATVKSVVTAVEEIAAAFLTQCVDRVAPVAKDVEAFAMVQEAAEGFLRFIMGKVDEAARMAAGAGPRGRVTDAARSLYSEGERALRRQIEIHRFTFTVPQSSPMNSGFPTAPAAPQPSATPEPQKNRGGKPLAGHWDQMWAAIAVMLYSGDLKPKTQADIERAMKDWLSANDFDAGDTAVRGRARKLWHELVRSD